MTRETEAIERVSLGWLGDEMAVEDDASGHVPRRASLHSRSFATSSQARRRRVHYLYEARVTTQASGADVLYLSPAYT
jgi:hypothetical protein